MIYGYARVSTGRQVKDGNSLDNPEKLLLSARASKIFVDCQSSKNITRTELNILLDTLQANDTHVVTKLDRLEGALLKVVKLNK